MLKKIAIIVLVFSVMAGHFGVVQAKGDYELYFFGVNIDSFNDCNWLHVIAGAAASLLVHELGHALYLESQEQKWNFELSASSGMAITFSDSISQRQYRDFGRAGFALQTGIGLLLASIPASRGSDFTKGWVGINTVQLYTYDVREHEHGNDFSMIDKGGGNPDLDMGIMAVVNSFCLLQSKDAKDGQWFNPEEIKTLRQEPSPHRPYPGVFDSLNISPSF